MTDLQIAWLELVLVGGGGVLLLLAGITVKVVQSRKNRRCTEKTTGIVVKHIFYGKGSMCPVIEYRVDGKEYRTRKKYKGVKLIKVSGPPLPIRSDAYEDEKGWLHVKTGPTANLRVLAEKLWPYGSETTVYYSPENPKKCYVERPVSGGIVTIIFTAMGIGIIIMSIFMFFLIKS